MYLVLLYIVIGVFAISDEPRKMEAGKTAAFSVYI
jgi:hypothetical protein